MKEMQVRLGRAAGELRRMRDELRVKLHLLGMEAHDVLDDAEDLLWKAERRLEGLAARARHEARGAATYLRARLHLPPPA